MAFRAGGSWWMPEVVDACVTSRIDVATTRYVASVLAGMTSEDGRERVWRGGLSANWPYLYGTSLVTGSHRPEASLAEHECDQEIALFVDQDSSTQVSYFVWSHARHAELEPVPSRGGEIRYDALAIPRAVYIAKNGPQEETVRFALQHGRYEPWNGRVEEWDVRTLWGPAPAGQVIAVALDVGPSRDDHVALLTTSGVLLLRPTDAGVEQDVVDAAPIAWDGSPGTTIAVAVDAKGDVHLAWVVPAEGPAHGQIRYALDEGEGWEVETVDEGDAWADLAVDPHGRPHVSWALEQRGEETAEHPGRYATFSAIDGIDQNCDGVDGVDADGDGRASVETGGDDSDDANPVR